MTKNLLIEIIEKLQKVCQKNRIKMALAGGIAVGAYAIPRATYDVDGFILVSEDKMDLLLSSLIKQGFIYDKHKPIKIIQGKRFVTLLYSKYKMYIDLFVAEGDFQTGMLKRAKKVKFNKIKINIISPEDLILLKLQAGRERDVEDVRGIISENISRLNFNYLKRWSRKLGVDLFLKEELESLGKDIG